MPRQTTTPRVRRRRLLPGILAALLLAGAVRAAPGPSVRLREALAAGDLTGAREALLDWIDRDPDRAPLHYNLACLEALLGEDDRAVTALDRAFRLGFDDVRRAAADPDLAALAEHPGFRDLLAETRLGLERSARRRAVALTEGRRLPLRLAADGRPVTELQAALTVSPAGFGLEFTAPAGALADGPEPWRRGGGVLLVLAAPRPDDVFDTSRAWTFGFGRRDGLPVGVVLSRPDRVVGTQVLELAPEIAWDKAAGTRTLRVTVPWSYVAPYALPADSLFGVNVAFAGAPDGSAPAAELVPDPALRGDEPGPRRYLPLTLRPSPDGPARLSGVVPNTVVGRAPLPVDLGVWSPAPTAAVLDLTVEDNEGRSVVASGGGAEPLELPAGTTLLRRWADLSALPDGPYRLRARLVLADSTAAEWRSGLFRFRGDWAFGIRDRTKALPPAQKASVTWRLELIETSLSTRDPRSSPAPLMTTVAETEAMVRAYTDRGTILPTSGEVTLIWPADTGPRQVAVSLPAGWSPDTPPPLLVLETAPARALAPELRDRAVLAAPDAADGLEAADRSDLTSWLGSLLPGAEPWTAGAADSDFPVGPQDVADADARRAAARRLLDAAAGR